MNVWIAHRAMAPQAAARAHSLELREKEWDMAARIRERALADTRDQVNVLMQELAADRAELRFRDASIADLERSSTPAERRQFSRRTRPAMSTQWCLLEP